MLDEGGLGAKVAQQMLAEDQLVPRDVRETDEEDIGTRAARETRRLGVEEENILPRARRVALEPEVRDEERIARSPSDDLETEVVECDAPLTYLERPSVARRDRCRADVERGHRVVAGMSGAVPLDDLRDARAKVVQAPLSRCATDSRTSGPSA